jgi:hypothetical protein
MAFDEGLAERIRDVLEDRSDVTEKRMFGGLAFLVGGKMSAGIVGDDLMVRVGPDDYDRVLKERHVRKMDFTGRPMRGFVFVAPDGFEADRALQKWIALGVAFATSVAAKGEAPGKRPRPTSPPGSTRKPRSTPRSG